MVEEIVSSLIKILRNIYRRHKTDIIKCKSEVAKDILD